MAAVIKHYQRKMDRHPDQPEIIVHCLTKLLKLEGVSIASLQSTGAGKTVNTLKKSQNPEVRDIHIGKLIFGTASNNIL